MYSGSFRLFFFHKMSLVRKKTSTHPRFNFRFIGELSVSNVIIYRREEVIISWREMAWENMGEG